MVRTAISFVGGDSDHDLIELVRVRFALGRPEDVRRSNEPPERAKIARPKRCRFCAGTLAADVVKRTRLRIIAKIISDDISTEFFGLIQDSD